MPLTTFMEIISVKGGVQIDTPAKSGESKPAKSKTIRTTKCSDITKLPGYIAGLRNYICVVQTQPDTRIVGELVCDDPILVDCYPSLTQINNAEVFTNQANLFRWMGPLGVKIVNGRKYNVHVILDGKLIPKNDSRVYVPPKPSE